MKRYKLTPIIFLLVILCLSFSRHAPAQQAGTLDPDFGTNGIVPRLSVPNQQRNWINDAVLQPDGKIVVAGRVTYSVATYPHSQQGRFLLARYKADGNLDLDFGAGGISVIPFGRYASAETVSLQPDGKVLAAGTTLSNDLKDLTLARYNSDGSLDTSFGTGGIVIDDFAGFEEVSEESPVESVILPDNKILIVGKKTSRSAVFQFDNELISVFIARYNPDGTPDLSFGNNGRIVRFNSQNYGDVNTASMQPDGKILVSTRSYKVSSNGQSNLTAISQVTRYNADGTVDTGFAVNGALRFVPSEAIIHTQTLPNGEIMIYNNHLIVVNSDGSFNRTLLSGSFWINSKLFFPVRFNAQSDGKIIVFGAFQEISSIWNPAAVRLLPDGQIDSSFGENGIFFKRTTRHTILGKILIQPDGKIIGVNDEYSTTSEINMVRLFGSQPNAATTDRKRRSSVEASF